MKIKMAVLISLTVGYVAGANALWVSNAFHVSRVTGAPVLRVIDPLHRSWLGVALAPFQTADFDDEEDMRRAESQNGADNE